MLLAVYVFTIHWAAATNVDCAEKLAGSRRALIEIFTSSQLEFPQTTTATRFQLLAHAILHPVEIDTIRQRCTAEESRELVEKANRAHLAFGAKVIKSAEFIQDGTFLRLAGDLDALDEVRGGDRLALARRLEEYFRSSEYTALARRLRVDLAALLTRRAAKPRRALRTTVSADAQKVVRPHVAELTRRMLGALEREPRVSIEMIEFVYDTLRH